MSQINLKSVILGVEATKGTPPAATAFYSMPISKDVGLAVTANSGTNDVLNGARLTNEDYLTTRSVSGTIPITADYSNVYFPLALAMGVPATVTDNANTTYTRIFTPQNLLPTVSVQREVQSLDGLTSFYELFSGVAIDGWSINIQDEKLQVPMNAKGGVVSDTNDAGFTPIAVASAKTLTDTAVRKAHAVLKKGGVAYGLSSTFSIQVGNSISEVWYIGDGEYPSGLDFGKFTMSGTIQGIFDAAFLATAKNLGRIDFDITFTSSADPLVKLTFTLTNVFIKYKTIPYNVGQRATLSLDWAADIHSTVSVTLTNKVAVY